ncbi:MAG: hypothetical protein AAF216_04365 [Pseudomonadota bacterium]
MAKHATKQTGPVAHGEATTSVSAPLSVAGPDDVAVPSPARSLQSGLELEITQADLDFSMRDVLGAFIVFCFAAWWALYMLVVSLV